MRRIKAVVSCGFAIAFLLCIAAATLDAVPIIAPKLGKGEAKKLIQRFAGGDFGEDNVQVVGEISTLGSSATAEAQIKTAFRFAREEGRWHVVEVRTGENRWEDVRLITAALDGEKRLRAGAELEMIRMGIENFRRERGFYVVAADARVLADALAPRFLARVIRVDPWHRPYRYQGTLNRFALSSDGADGVENTADDVRITNANP